MVVWMYSNKFAWTGVHLCDITASSHSCRLKDPMRVRCAHVVFSLRWMAAGGPIKVEEYE